MPLVYIRRHYDSMRYTPVVFQSLSYLAKVEVFVLQVCVFVWSQALPGPPSGLGEVIIPARILGLSQAVSQK